MAGNMIVIGSKFKPFSYDDMIKPIQLADAEHKALEGEMTELSSRAGVFDKLANEQTDPEAYAMYKKYSDDLNMQAETLAKSGLNPDSRTAISKMRQRYSQEITPIENAYKRRDELTKEQREAMLKDPTLMMSQAASTLSLDDLIKNPNMSYQAYSGNMLTQQAAQAAKELAKYQQEKPREWRKILGGQYFESMMNRGYTPEQVIMAAMDDPNAPKELKKIADDVYSSSGIDTWGDDLTKQRAKEFIGRGLYSAIGDTQYQQVQNQEYLDPLQRAKLKGMQSDNPNRPYRTVPRTKVTGSETGKLQEDIDFINLVRQKPEILNEKAKRSVLKEARAYGTTWGSYGMQEEYQPNVERLKSITSKYGTTDPDKIVDMLNKEIRQAAVRDNSYVIDITDPTFIAKNIRENATSLGRRSGNTGVYELDDDNKKGDQVGLEDINKYFTKDVQIEYEPKKGIVLSGVDSKGNTKSFLLDPEIVTGQSLEFEDKASGRSRRTNAYQHLMNLIEEGMETGDAEQQEFYIDLLMKNMYSQFNSLSKRQGSTLSAKEEAGG